MLIVWHLFLVTSSIECVRISEEFIFFSTLQHKAWSSFEWCPQFSPICKSHFCRLAFTSWCHLSRLIEPSITANWVLGHLSPALKLENFWLKKWLNYSFIGRFSFFPEMRWCSCGKFALTQFIRWFIYTRYTRSGREAKFEHRFRQLNIFASGENESARNDVCTSFLKWARPGNLCNDIIWCPNANQRVLVSQLLLLNCRVTCHTMTTWLIRLLLRKFCNIIIYFYCC